VAAPVRVNNGAALLGAARGILPYAILFYVIDFFIWYSNAQPRFKHLDLVSLRWRIFSH
jgi:hypothetical protein